MMVVKATKRRTHKKSRFQKKRRLQHRSRHRSRGRKPVGKKRKPSDQGQHQPTKRRRRASKRSFLFDAKKLKGAKRSGRFLSREAKGLMIAFMEDIYKQVSREAERLRRESRKAVVSPMHVQAALQTLVPTGRWKQAAFRTRHCKKAPSPQGRGFKAPQLLRASAMHHEEGV